MPRALQKISPENWPGYFGVYLSVFNEFHTLFIGFLIDKKGIKYAAGSKKPYTGRVFDNYKNKGRKLTGSFKNGKMNGSWTFWKEDGVIDREEAYTSSFT